MDFKKMADKAGALAAQSADTIGGAAETLKDQAGAIGDNAVSKVAGTATSLVGKAADALGPRKK